MVLPHTQLWEVWYNLQDVLSAELPVEFAIFAIYIIPGILPSFKYFLMRTSSSFN